MDNDISFLNPANWFDFQYLYLFYKNGYDLIKARWPFPTDNSIDCFVSYTDYLQETNTQMGYASALSLSIERSMDMLR